MNEYTVREARMDHIQYVNKYLDRGIPRLEAERKRLEAELMRKKDFIGRECLPKAIDDLNEQIKRLEAERKELQNELDELTEQTQ